MQVSIIVAISENGVIGRIDTLPWHLSADLKRFKRLTMGHSLIMGRRTYESIGRPLPGRTSIVLTSNQEFQAAGCLMAANFKHGLELAKQHDTEDDKKVFIVGGRSVYEVAEPLADRLYLTVVHAQIEGDTYFPHIDWKNWSLVEEQRHPKDPDNDWDYSFKTFERAKTDIAT